MTKYLLRIFMLPRRFVPLLFSTAITTVAAGLALGQDYPNKPIRIIASVVGGSIDFTSRNVAGGLSGALGQPVVVENRGSNVISIEIVARATPDGYTLLTTTGLLWVTPLLQGIRDDPLRDFSPITETDASYNILAVHPSLAVNSV